VDVNALREEHNQIMAKARALAAKAADREFTEQEQRVAVELQRQAADVERRLKQAEDDAEVKKAIADLGNAIGGASTAPVSVKAEPARPVHPRVRAAGGTAGWGQAVLKANSNDGFGFKSLLPTGSVAVSVPLRAEPVRLGEPVLSLRQVVPVIPDTVGRWSYLRQSVRTSNAAVVPAGTRKPTSVFSLVREEGRSVTIAHLSEYVRRQDLDDAPTLEGSSTRSCDSAWNLPLRTRSSMGMAPATTSLGSPMSPVPRRRHSTPTRFGPRAAQSPCLRCFRSPRPRSFSMPPIGRELN
jgi:hypothetical protein